MEVHHTGASTISGVGASSGRATGYARYIEIDKQDRPVNSSNIQGIEEVQTGDIVIISDVLPIMCGLLKEADGLVIYDEKQRTGRGSTALVSSIFPL